MKNKLSPIILLTVILLVGCDISMLSDLTTDLANEDSSLSADSSEITEKRIFATLQTAVQSDIETSTIFEDIDTENQDESQELSNIDINTDNIEISVDTVLNDVIVPTEQTDENAQTSIIHGKLIGKFSNDIPDSTSATSPGTFEGKWVDSNDELKGYIKGTYRPLSTDALPKEIISGGIFEGRFVDTEGQFKGIIKGRYGQGQKGGNLFAGYWLDEDNHLIGILKGHWKDELDVNGGTFAGRWAKLDLCAEIRSLPPFEFAPDDVGGYQATDEELTEQDLNTEIPSTILNLGTIPCIDIAPEEHYGYLYGRHIPNSETQPAVPPIGGKFRGRWFTADNTLAGILIGHYQPIANDVEQEINSIDNDKGNATRASQRRANSERRERRMNGNIDGDEDNATAPETGKILGTFYGKYVDTEGNFHGYIRGVYGVSVHNAGVFRGQYISANLEHKGILFGRWTLRPVNRPGGLFAGFWKGNEITDIDNISSETEETETQ